MVSQSLDKPNPPSASANIAKDSSTRIESGQKEGVDFLLKQDLDALERAFYTDLSRFKQVCFRLIERGQPYQVAILCHELLRYLYPYEPYTGFKHTDPVRFAAEHQKNLLALGERLLETVQGYEVDLTTVPDGANATLETRTSDLYSDLWAEFDQNTLLVEARKLLEGRLSSQIVEEHIKGKRVFDMGCGSGRYAIALAALGAAEVVAADYQSKAYQAAEHYAQKAGLPISFCEADVLSVPLPDRYFDFVFSNGVLMVTRDWKHGVAEYSRLMKTSGYMYLYANRGFLWRTRAVMRDIFKLIPRQYTQDVLKVIGLPKNRFFFMDSWYVPIEGHIARAELEALFSDLHLRFAPIRSTVPFDPDYGLGLGLPGGEIMWGEGEHRYLILR